MIRIDHLLSQTGYCSRKDALEWCRSGRVKVNGEIVKIPKTKVDPTLVTIDDEPIDHPLGIFIMLNKPEGYVCSHDSSEGLRVYDLLPEQWQYRNPAPTSIGRLDKDATGLILITDIMPWVHNLTSPKRHVQKTYLIEADKEITSELMTQLEAGTLILEGETKPCLPAKFQNVNGKTCEMIIEEGRYHQVKRMFAACGFHVEKLHRLKFGEYELGNLELGTWKEVPLPK